MERLTFDGNFCDIAMCFQTPGGSYCEDGACSQKKVWERLKTYEDAEEQGWLMRLPCKIGDTIYEVNLPDELAEVCEYEVQDISAKQICFADDWFPISIIGESVFLTREAAESALKEGEG